MKEDQFQVLLSEIRKVGKRMDDAEAGLTRIENDLAGDRHDINDFRVNLGRLDERVKELDGSISRLQGKIKDTVHTATAEMVEPVLESAQNLTSQIKKKKTLRIMIQPETIIEKVKRGLDWLAGKGVK